MANNTTAPVSTDLTLVEQWMQYIIFYIGFGVIGALGNGAIAIGIIRSSELRSRFFIVIFTLVCVRITIAYQFIVTGMYRALKALNTVEAYQTRISCHILHLFIPVSFTVELSLLLVLVIDRILAIMTPVAYKSLSRRQAKIVCVSVVVVVGVFGKLIPSMIGWDFFELIPCLNAYSAPSANLNLYFQNSDLPIIVLVLVLYGGLWIYVKWRVEMLKRQNSFDQQTQFKRKLAVLPLLRNIIVAHTAITLVAKLLTALVPYVPEQSIRLTAYSGNLNTVDLILNVAVLLGSNKEINMASVPACCRRDNRVNSFVPSGPAEPANIPAAVEPARQQTPVG